MERNKRLCTAGYLTFFLSGICAISSGIIVNILQEKYGFSYGMTGTLLSVMSIGNMAASFASGMLTGRIGMRITVLFMSCGYFLGYLLMTVNGAAAVLIAAFLLVGIAKGCALNSCTVLVGNHSEDRTKGISVLHGMYAFGALLCPFLIAVMAKGGVNLPMIGVAAAGALLWILFLTAGLPGPEKKSEDKKRNSEFAFLRQKRFWMLTALIFCQNAAETSVTGWLVTYYKNQGILSGAFSNYTVTVMWSATLIARMLIAFVFPIKNTFKALSVMGFGCTVLYGAMIFVKQPILAVVLLFAFAFSMAGVNPIAVAGVGKELSAASVGVLLPIGSIGAIVMPWIIGKVADYVNLQVGMACNLVGCVGIMVISMILYRKTSMAAE